MRIVILPVPEGNVIARESQFGVFEADFVVSPDGQVSYHHPSDRPWFAASTEASFREAAAAWNRYCDEALATYTDDEQHEAVEGLRAELERIGVLDQRADNLWLCLLEQARDGLL
jgi:hypothetical protein